MRSDLRKSILVFVILISVLPSCRKADRDTDTSTQMVTDHAFAAYFINNLYKQVHQYALSDSLMNVAGSSFISDTACIDGVTHTNTPGLFPDTVVVNYGLENGTACADANLRRGKIKIIFSGKYGTAGKYLTVYPEFYHIDDYKIEGKMTIACKSRNTANNLLFSVTVDTAVISTNLVRMEFFSPANSQLAPLQREWSTGELTADISDDIFLLTGTYGSKTPKGTFCNSEITSALNNAMNCKWIAGGKETISPLNLSPRVVDYGSGCDAKVTANINGKEYEVAVLP